MKYMIGFFLFLCLNGCNFPTSGLDNPQVRYTSFLKAPYEMHSWESPYSVLLAEDPTLDDSIVFELLSITDSAYQLLKNILKREPKPGPIGYIDKVVIAVVDSTCGPGCGYIGHKGIEIQKDYFSKVYAAMVKDGAFDTLIFYELGRNFWFFDELYKEKHDPLLGAIRKGYATFLRCMLVTELKVKPAEYNGKDFWEFFETEENKFSQHLFDSYGGIEQLLSSLITTQEKKNDWIYEMDPTLFWSALFFHMYKIEGLHFMKMFFRGMLVDSGNAFNKNIYIMDIIFIGLNHVKGKNRKLP